MPKLASHQSSRFALVGQIFARLRR